MKEELITFETAKLAKEKGFDIPCTHGYTDLEEGHKQYGEIRNWNHAYDSSFPREKNSEMSQAFTAPTQSLLQKWLREVHNIHINVSPDITPDEIKSTYYYSNWRFINEKRKAGSYYEYKDCITYEQALEVGLQEALKLINP